MHYPTAGTDSIAVAEHKQGTARLNTCIIEKGKQSQADDQIGVGAVSTTKEVEEASSRGINPHLGLCRVVDGFLIHTPNKSTAVIYWWNTRSVVTFLN